jgi:hypothetical protein
VVVVGGGGGGGAVVVVVGDGAGGSLVVVVGRAVVEVVDCGDSYATRCERRFTLFTRSRSDDGYTTPFWLGSAASAVAVPWDACVISLCSRRKGKPNNVPQSIAATPRRLPRVLCFRRAPPFSGISAPAPTRKKRRGVLEKLDNQYRRWQTRDEDQPILSLFPQVIVRNFRDI